MKFLRPNVPLGIHVWRDPEHGSILAAAAVWADGFGWCGRESETPPGDLKELALQPGREIFWLSDDEKTEYGWLPGPDFLRAIVAAGLDEPGRLCTFTFPGGAVETTAAVKPLDLNGPDSVGIQPRWDDPTIVPANEQARIRRYRLHQSWYRENILATPPGSYGNFAALGSYLPVDADDRLNFLTAEAAAHAVERIATVRSEGGTLDPARLRHNMLSSMPLCFNLFGSLRAEPAFIILFQCVFDPAATLILDVICEYAPQPPAKFLGDRTAFDAIVLYETAAGPRFLGVETKYTESFSRTEYDLDRYREVTATSGWFANPTAPTVLRGRKSNQLWRNLLLAASLEQPGHLGSGAVAVVAPADDPGATAAIDILREHLTDQNRLLWTPIETILDVADAIPELADWSTAFRIRYVT